MKLNFYDSWDREKIRDYLNYELNTLKKTKKPHYNSANFNKVKFPKIINFKENDILNCTHEINYNCLLCCKGNLNLFYNEERLVSEKLFRDFTKDVNLCNTLNFTNLKYHNSSVDKQKLIKFYESNTELYMTKLQKNVNKIIIQFKNYLIEKVNDISKVTSEIFYNLLNFKKNEFNNIMLKIIDDKTENIYNEVTFNKLIKQYKECGSNFLNYNNIFDDINQFIKIVNTNFDYKKEFLKDHNYYKKLKNISISKYLELIKKNLNNILSYKDYPNNNFNELSKDINIKYKDKLIQYNPISKDLFKTDNKNDYLLINNLSKIVHKTNHNSNDVITNFEIIEGGRFILSVSKDLSLRWTNTFTNSEKFSIKNLHTDSITSLIWLPNSMAATSSKDGKIKIIDLFTHKIWYELNKHSDWINQIIEIDQNYIVTAGDDSLVKFINLTSLSVIKTIKCPDNRPVKTILNIKNTNFLIIGSRKIYIYNYLKDIIEKSLNGHFSYIKHLEYDYDRNQLISIGDDKYFIIWNILNSEIIGKFTLSLEIKTMIVFKSYYVLSTYDNYLYFWNPDLKIIIKKVKLNIFSLCLRADYFNGLFYSQYNDIVQLKNINLED